jgi:hypothetical protein
MGRRDVGFGLTAIVSETAPRCGAKSQRPGKVRIPTPDRAFAGNAQKHPEDPDFGPEGKQPMYNPARCTLSLEMLGSAL